MSRERLDQWCERGILAMVLAVLVFGPLATGAVRPLEFLVLQSLTMGAALLWLFRLWLKPTQRILWPPVCWAVIAFVAYAIVRYRQADIEYVARQELIRILVYACLFFVILNNLARQEWAQTISLVLFFLGMAISMYAVYQCATHSGYVWHFVKPEVFRARGSGTYINPNHLAGFLEMLVPLGLAYALTGRVGHLFRVFVGYATFVMLAGIGVTLSRGGWAATVVALAIFFALLIRRRQYRIPALIVLAAMLAAGAYSYSVASRAHNRIENILSAQSPETARIRFWLWQPALKMWLDHPWLGVGPAHFDYRFPAYRPETVQARPGHVHNDYLNVLVDWGVTGASVLVLCFGLLFWGVFRVWKFVRREQSELGTRPSNRAAFVLGASLGLVAILIHSFSDFNMYIPANAIVAVTWMALLSSHIRFATERYWFSPGPTARLAATSVGLLCVAYLGQQGWQRAHEYFWLDRAARETAYTSTMVSALRAAAAVEPKNPDTTYALGEALRRRGWEDDTGSDKSIVEAREWFHRGTRLNPFDPYNYMRIGMCLDWLGRQDEAGPYFEKALQCDPNNYYVLAHHGWHFFQLGDYLTAKKWFERSVNLYHAWHNPIAAKYLSLIERKLKEPQAPATP